MSKRTYSKEEVIYDRQQSTSKSGSNGGDSSMQPVVGNLRMKTKGSKEEKEDFQFTSWWSNGE